MESIYRRTLTKEEQKRLIGVLNSSSFVSLATFGAEGQAYILEGNEPLNHEKDYCNQVNSRIIGYLGSRYVRLIEEESEIKQNTLELIADTLPEQD